MMAPNDRKYSKEHEWVLIEENGRVLVGITHYAQDQLGDLVFLDLLKTGTIVKQFENLGEIESVKSVSDIYSPISGEIVQENTKVKDQPALVNSDPYGEGWLVRIAMSDPSELDNLLSARQYEAFLVAQEE
jgi:glycine cleavage system H protein